MIRKFNYTGRKKIEKSKIHIWLVRDTTLYPYFDMKLSLSPEDFPENSELFVEAYDSSSFMRFKCGTPKNPLLPEERHLTGLHSTDSITFRVKLVDPSAQHGKILGIADRISSIGESQEDTRHISLLPVTYADIEKEIWKLDFRDAGPVLVINSNIDAVPVTELIRSNDLFFSLFFSALYIHGFFVKFLSGYWLLMMHLRKRIQMPGRTAGWHLLKICRMSHESPDLMNSKIPDRTKIIS